MIKTVLVFLLLRSPQAHGYQTAISLDQLQKTYVGHRAYVQISTVACWKKVADVVSIVQLPAQLKASDTKVNALGERTANPASQLMVELTVRCPNGSVEKASILADVVSLALSLRRDSPASSVEIAASEKKYQPLVGSTVYSKKDSKLYSISSSINDLEDANSPKRYIYLEPLTPLKVTKIKVWGDDSGTFLALKLLSPDSREFLAAFSMIDQQGQAVPNPVANSLYLSQPSCFVDGMTRNENLETGMFAKAVVCQWGEPNKTNDYGLGGEQWIYTFSDSQTKYVYLKNGRVTDVQSLNH